MIYNPLIYQEALVIFIESVFVFQFNEYFFKSPLDYGQTSNKHRILRCGAYYRKLFITLKILLFYQLVCHHILVCCAPLMLPQDDQLD